MTGTGGLISVLLKETDKKKIEEFSSTLKAFLFAVSWGGHESLALPFCSLFDIPGHPDPNIPVNLVRLYIGLEDPDYLISDLDNALNQLG